MCQDLLNERSKLREVLVADLTEVSVDSAEAREVRFAVLYSIIIYHDNSILVILLSSMSLSTSLLSSLLSQNNFFLTLSYYFKMPE